MNWVKICKYINIIKDMGIHQYIQRYINMSQYTKNSNKKSETIQKKNKLSEIHNIHMYIVNIYMYTMMSTPKKYKL